MEWIAYALALVGALAWMVLLVIFNLTDYKLILLPYMWLAYFVWAVGSLLVVADGIRAFMARRKVSPAKKDELEIK